MGILDELKKLARPTDDYYDDEFEDFSPRQPERIPAEPRGSVKREREPQEEPVPRPRGGGYFTPETHSRDAGKVVNIHATTQLSVVLVKPDRFENAAEVADHLREKRTVVLNLESTNKDIARRLIDFLSGVAYAQEGKIKKVAVSTYIITPYNVDILGDLIDELENNGLYF
ncbi:MAG: cell division protein SepF [Oscillospiraceae bacterium]|nr:cell division protein SepF [Oscillospiraceae bacterium]